MTFNEDKTVTLKFCHNVTIYIQYDNYFTYTHPWKVPNVLPHILFKIYNAGQHCGCWCAGAHFTNNFSITIQMWWKFNFALIQIQIKWSLQNFAHDTTAVLSWQVQDFVAILSAAIKLDESTAPRQLKSPQSLSGRSIPLVTFEAWSSINMFAFRFVAIGPFLAEI